MTRNLDSQDHGALAARFEGERSRLRGIAYRMLGALGEAEDAVQEVWLRLDRSGPDEIDNLGGWLTTVTARVCLDVLRSRRARREDSLDAHAPERMAAGAMNPEEEAAMADALGHALLVVLQSLDPAERVAFVLHDMFDLPFGEIAPIVGRSEPATRQLASRARRRVRGRPVVPPGEMARQRAVIDAFVTASRGGDLPGLLAVLAPEVVFRSDATGVRRGAAAELHGAEAVAATFVGRAQGARLALVGGLPGLVVLTNGVLFVAITPTIEDGRIIAIDAVLDPERLARLEIAVLD